MVPLMFSIEGALSRLQKYIDRVKFPGISAMMVAFTLLFLVVIMMLCATDQVATAECRCGIERSSSIGIERHIANGKEIDVVINTFIFIQLTIQI